MSTKTTKPVTTDFRMLPAELTPINLHAYLFNAFHACGCTDLESIIETVVKFLEWSANSPERYDALFASEGVYYIIAGLFDDLDLTTHGVAIRYPIILADGQRLLAALKQYNPEEVENASGKAYDGLWYNL